MRGSTTLAETILTLLLILTAASPFIHNLKNRDLPTFSTESSLVLPHSPSTSSTSSSSSTSTSTSASSSSSSTSTHLTTLETRRVALTKRAPPNGGQLQWTYALGWIIKYRQYVSFIVPVQVAATVLEEFLTDALRGIALRQTANEPSPGRAFTLNVGSVFLAFRVADSTQVIQWWGVGIIVDAVLQNVRKGFTSQFRSEWYHPDTNVRVYVSLSILQRIGPRPP